MNYKLFKEFKKFGRELFLQGLNNSHSGNMSIRRGKSIYITRHGARLADLHQEDIIPVSFNTLRGREKTSVEIIVHLAIYKSLPVKAIVHCHPPEGIVLSFHYNKIIPIDPEGKFYFKPIPVLRVKTAIGSPEVARKLPGLLKKNPIAMVRGHGSFAVGENLEEAYHRSSVFGYICKILLYHRLLKPRGRR